MQPGSGTRVDAAITGLLELLEAGKVDTKVKVLDGDQPVAQVPDAVIVASADPDTPGVIVTYGRDPSLGNANVEQAEIVIICRSYRGSKDMSVPRARAAAIVASVQKVVDDNPRRDDCWDKLELGAQALWHPVYTEKGCNVFVGFTVVASALI